MFIASDIIAFSGKTDNVVFLPDETFAIVFRDTVQLYDFHGNRVAAHLQKIDAHFALADKGEHKHFMLKEIYEQKNAIIKTVGLLRSSSALLLEQLGIDQQKAQNIESISFIACGTSWHAARIAQFFFESIVHIPVTVHLASEFRHASFFAQQNGLYVFISQSGETADTLEALRLVNTYGLSTIALTNVATSTIVREANGFLLTHAGPEVAVASTKAFSTQLAALYWLAHYIALEKDIIEEIDLRRAETDLYAVAHVLENSIEQHKKAIDQVHALRYAHHDKAFFLGRHISYPFAMEVALKLKEIAYVCADSYAAGELKHGSLALVDDTMPVYIFSHRDPIIYQKLLSNAYEVKARGGKIIVFAYAGQDELCTLAETAFIISADVPALLGPLAMIGLAQYFVYAIAKERGCPIDKPRNLAKSVTVE
jgi:glucosamine--fructose-6-phosphate aminotransferase (isomerizing)